jgi:hypothetical protein
VKEIKAATMLILCFACLAVLGNTSVRAYNVGVTTGYLKYDVNFSVNASGQSYSEGAQITVNITGVNDTMIEGTIEVSNITGSLPTGSPIPLLPPSGEQPFSINTTTWATSYPSLPPIIIPADLRAGDSVPGDGTVQNLTDWNGRTAMVINASESVGLPGSAEFDEQTGVFLEASGSINHQGYVATYSIKLTNTNLFGTVLTLLGVAWWIWAIAIAVIVGIILGVVVPNRRRRKSTVQPQATPPPPPSPAPA